MNKNSIKDFSLSRRLLNSISVLFCLILAIVGCSGATFDNQELLRLSIESREVTNWHSPYYVVIVRALNHFGYQTQFYVQLVIYLLFLLLVVRNGPFKLLGGALFFLLASPLTFYFFQQMGKDQLVVALFLYSTAGIINLINGNFRLRVGELFLIGCGLFIVILIRPNLGLFFLPALIVMFWSPASRKHLFVLIVFAIAGYVFYSFSWGFFKKIGFTLHEQYFLQYVFYSDLINLSIRDGVLHHGIQNISNLMGCQKQLYLDKVIEMKMANTVNLNGIWNIDNILNDPDFGVCRVTNPEIYEALKNYWITEVTGNPLPYIEIRLAGFTQLFLHDTNTLVGKIGSALYSPIWLVILIMYFVLMTSNVKYNFIYYGMGLGLALYLMSLFIFAPGYDLRYCLPISLGSIAIILISQKNHKI